MKTENKYSKLSNFITALKIDKGISQCLYLKTNNIQYLKEYLYNKNMLLTIRDEFKNKKFLKSLITANKISINSDIIAKKLNLSLRSFYRKADREYKDFLKKMYKIEDELYDKYINKGIVNENNSRTKSKGMERAL